MKFAFKTPTGIHFAARNIKPVTILKVGEINCYVFDKNIYISEGKVKYLNPKLDHYVKEFFSVFAEFDGHLMNLRHFHNEPIQKIEEFLTNNIAQIKIWRQEYSKLFANVEQYNQNCLNKIAEKNRKRETEEKQRQIREEKAQIEEEKEAAETFKKGEFISWPQFEMLCKKHQIEIPARTLGAARNNIKQINKNRTVRHINRPPQKLGFYVDLLAKVI